MSQESALNTPYAGLTPEVVLGAVESLGLIADGRLLALNSYENRVYRVGLEEGADMPGGMPQIAQVVAKFYRHGRWTDVQIREEHAFATELAADQLPVVAPLQFGGESLHRHDGFRFALFECRAGHGAEIDQPGHRALLGRTLGAHARHRRAAAIPASRCNQPLAQRRAGAGCHP